MADLTWKLYFGLGINKYYNFGPPKVESPSFIFGSGNRRKNKRNNSSFRIFCKPNMGISLLEIYWKAKFNKRVIKFNLKLIYKCSTNV